MVKNMTAVINRFIFISIIPYLSQLKESEINEKVFFNFSCPDYGDKHYTNSGIS